MRKNRTNKKKNKPISNLIKYSEKNRVDTLDLTQNITFELISNQNDSEEKNHMRYLKEEIVIKNKTIDWFDFSNCFFDNKISFEECIFKGGLSFEKSIFNSDISFKKCIFKGKTDFRNISFKGKSEFLNCTFDSSENNTIKKINFSGRTFEQEANFSGSIFNLKVDFSRTIFGIKKENNNSYESSSEVKFLIENAKFQKEVDFSKAIFYDAIYFSGTEFCTDIEDYAKESINFENAQFKRKVRFHHCKFRNTVRFENTSFNKLVDFYCAHFYKPQQFHFTDFLDRAIFSNTEFDEEVQFLHCRVDSNSYIRFESATFKKSLDISRSNFNDKANFWNIELEERDAFTSSKYQDDFEVHKNEINSEKTVSSIYKQLRETYRIIKSNFYSQNNKIEGLKFYKREMSVYEREIRSLSWDKIRSLSWDKIRSLSWDKILLFANKISSNFGTSWSRGLLFTVIAGIITLLPISCNLKFSLTLEGVGNFLKGLVDILNLTDWNEMTILGEKLTNWQYIFLFMGRIFVAYGVYQTIQAFRKFGKS